MDTKTLREILRRGEDSRTEFKESMVHPDDLAAAVVAFANTEGGRLLIGVQDDGTVEGIGHPDRILRTIDNVCYQHCEPPLPCTAEKVNVGRKLVIVATVPKGPDRPYRTNRGVYYIRGAAGRRQATQEELLRLYQATYAVSADEFPVTGTSVVDVNLARFRQFFDRTYPLPFVETGLDLERTLRNMKLAVSADEGTVLTVAGLLLFGEAPQARLPFLKIVAVRVEGVEIRETFLDRKDIEGTLSDQIEGAEAWLRLQIRVSGEIKGFKREDRPEIPLEILREAVVNAVAHRDYTIRSNVRLFVFDDRVEVRSPGRLPNTVTLENIRYGIHAERNPVIVSFLTKMGFMSQVGTGILRMIRLSREHIGREPEFEEVGGEFVVRVFKRQGGGCPTDTV